MKILKNRRGFTLVELIVVLVILAILAALLIPALTGYIDKAKRDQVVSETRMLHEAVQTVASEAYASNEWGTINDSGNSLTSIFTVANKGGTYHTGAYEGEQSATLKSRYNEIVKLAEVPSLTDGVGSFVAVVDSKGAVHCILYNTNRGLLGAYFRETDEYKVYDQQKNIDNYTFWYAIYFNSVISDATTGSSDQTGPWSQQVIDANLSK